MISHALPTKIVTGYLRLGKNKVYVLVKDGWIIYATAMQRDGVIEWSASIYG